MAQAASKTCEICVSAPGSWYCLDCEQHYCENCKTLHSRQKISTNHELKKASDFRIPEVKSKCTDHNEAFSFVCLDCDVQVCGCCVTEKHNGHKLSQFKDIISQLKSKIEQDFSLKRSITSVNVSKLKQSLSSFSGQVETVIKSITDEGNKIKSMVDQYTAKQIVSIQEQARKETERLAAILSDHKAALDKSNALDDVRKNLEESRHDGTLIQALKNLNREIVSLQVYYLPELPSATYIPMLFGENNISKFFGSYVLCESKTRKFGIKANALVDGDIFTCQKCGKQKIKDISVKYPKGHFNCCKTLMDKK